VCIWDARAIAGIETDKVREFSCAYRYVPVMEAGEFEGQAYDGRMTEIRGNHLALVEVGRAGSDVIVADANPFIKETAIMKKTKLGLALLASLSACSPVLAADSALAGLVGNASRKTFDKTDVKSKLLAMDASIDSNKLDNIIDAILDVEQSVEDPKPKVTPMAAADESPADKVKAMLAGKVDDDVIAAICSLFSAPAEDGYDKDGMSKEDVTAAMDAYGKELRTQLRDAEQARQDVRPVVGNVSVAMDSAADVYGFALDHMKVDRKDVEGTAALRALFKVASNKPATPVVTIAQDSATMAAMFPNAGRFGQV
jgi:hypothetical protein